MSIRATIFHEFHHLLRGWAIQDNKFRYEIPNALVNGTYDEKQELNLKLKGNTDITV